MNLIETDTLPVDALARLANVVTFLAEAALFQQTSPDGLTERGLGGLYYILDAVDRDLLRVAGQLS
ncbi:MAG: hypothetical protein AB7U59_17710 [Desulfovibrionaceae bacterium]